MALFNPPEHLSCHHYATQAYTGWILVNGSEQQLYQGETEYHSVLFCIQGSARLASGDELCELQVGQMKFIPRGSSVHAALSRDCMLLSAYFDVIDFLCDKLSLQQLKELKETVAYNPDPLEVRV